MEWHGIVEAQYLAIGLFALVIICLIIMWFTRKEKPPKEKETFLYTERRRDR